MLTDETKAYLRETVREVLKELPCKEMADRLSITERKVFNGFGASIAWLKWLVGMLYGGVVIALFSGLIRKLFLM